MLDKLKDLSKEELQVLLAKLLTEANEEKKETKSKNNSRQVRFEKNTFVDDGTLCKEDRKFTKEVQFQVSERRTVDSTLRKCSSCGTDFHGISTDKDCNDCILEKAGKK